MNSFEILLKIIQGELDSESLVHSYPWKIDGLIRRSAEILNFDNEELDSIIVEGSNFEQNRILKYLITKKLTNDPFNYKLLIWIVKEWGGIRAFKEIIDEDSQNALRIKDFHSRLYGNQALTADLFKVIPTLSKLSSFWDPTLFTIYDNRVIYTLNYLIYKANLKGANCQYFPIRGGSRNKMITDKPIETLIGMNNKYGFHEEGNAYQKYCELVRKLNKELYPNFPDEPFRTEMLLFSSINIPFKAMDGKFPNLNPKMRGKIKNNSFQRTKALTPNQKYYPIQELLSKAALIDKSRVKISIDELNKEISTIGKGPLPEAAFKYTVFWGNDASSPTHMQKRAWLSQGFIVANIDGVVNPNRIESDEIPLEQYVTFELVDKIEANSTKLSDQVLELSLYSDLEALYEKIQKDITTNAPNYFIKGLRNNGAKKTMMALMGDKIPSDGFTVLLLLGRLDLTLEYFLVSNEKYYELFEKSIIDTAKKRVGRI